MWYHIAPDHVLDVELTNAVGRVLQWDAFPDARQLALSVQDAIVQLRGCVPLDSVRQLAEFDAWCMFGVEGVDNRIETTSKTDIVRLDHSDQASHR